MNSRLNDWHPCANTLLAWGLWIIGSALVLTDSVFEYGGTDPGFLGLACIAFGTVRYVAGMLSQLDRRERRAFDLGRQYGGFQDDDKVTQIR